LILFQVTREFIYHDTNVDDMLVVGSNMKETVNLKASLAKKFSMKDFKPCEKILGMRISKEKRGC